MQVTAVILAGGRGTRMGGADKGLVSYQGQALIAHVIARLRPQVSQLIINANRNLASYQAFGYPVVSDNNADFDGPLAGMLAGLTAAATDWVLTVPCDTPHLPTDLVARLQQALHPVPAPTENFGAAGQEHAPQLAIACSLSGVHPICCLMPRHLANDLAATLAAQQRKVSAWQSKFPHVLVDFADDQAFTNVNHADDLMP